MIVILVAMHKEHAIASESNLDAHPADSFLSGVSRDVDKRTLQQWRFDFEAKAFRWVVLKQKRSKVSPASCWSKRM